MSRTIRRKTGNRWFAEKRPEYVTIPDKIKFFRGYSWKADNSGYEYVLRVGKAYCYSRAEVDTDLLKKYTSDSVHGYSYAKSVKLFDNSVRRACQRQQLRLIMKGQEHYDDSFEDSKCKGAAWYFD